MPAGSARRRELPVNSSLHHRMGGSPKDRPLSCCARASRCLGSPAELRWTAGLGRAFGLASGRDNATSPRTGRCPGRATKRRRAPRQAAYRPAGIPAASSSGRAYRTDWTDSCRARTTSPSRPKAPSTGLPDAACSTEPRTCAGRFASRARAQVRCAPHPIRIHGMQFQYGVQVFASRLR